MKRLILILVALTAIGWPQLAAAQGTTNPLFQTVTIGAPGGVVCVESSGSASPNGSVVGSPCDRYVQIASGTTGVFWLKATGTATNTGWSNVGAAGACTISAGALICTADTPTATTSPVAGNPSTFEATSAVAGSGAGTAIGGAVTITSGNAAGLTSGNQPGGAVTITSGNAVTFDSTTGSPGGAISLTAGNGASVTSGIGLGGAINLTAGIGGSSNSGTNTGGAVTITGGGGGAGTNGALGGAVVITGGLASAGSSTGINGGAVDLTGGNSNSSNGSGGDIVATGGVGGTNGNGGSLLFVSGAGASAGGASGSVTLASGFSPSTGGAAAASGPILIETGNNASYGVSPGSITIAVGSTSATSTAAGDRGGALAISSGLGGSGSGNVSTAGGAPGGPLTITGGNGGNASSNGAAALVAAGGGAPITVTTGTGGAETGAGNTHGVAGGVGGNLSLIASPGGVANGASGTRTGGAGGNVLLEAGLGGVGTSANGAPGVIQLIANGITWTWPTADGSTNFVLATNGSGALSFIAAGSGGLGTVTSVGWTGGLVSVASPTTTPAFTVAGTSGGIPYFSSASTWASSAALTANRPVIGGGAGTAPSVGTVSGNTTEFATVTGALVSGNCLQSDSNHNVVDSGTTNCGGGGGGSVTSVSFTGGLISVANPTSTPAFTVAGTSGGVPYFSSASTWATSAALASNDLALGGGAGSAPKTAAGLATDGTSIVELGVAGTSVGAVQLFNATSGSITVAPTTGALGTITATLQAATDTIVDRATTDTLTNKTLSSTTDVLGGVTMTLGSDATGDLYYRNSSGVLTRLGIGSSTNVLTVTGGLPTWAAAGGGGGSALSSITAATAQNNTIASGNNYGQTWNWALTSNSVTAMTFGETTAASGGTADNQALVGISVKATSTAIPLYIKDSNLTNAADAFRVDTQIGGGTPITVLVAKSGNLDIGTTAGVTDISNIFLHVSPTGGFSTVQFDSSVGKIGDYGGAWGTKDNHPFWLMANETAYGKVDPTPYFTLAKPAVSTIAAAKAYLMLGDGESGANDYWLMGFGYTNNVSNGNTGISPAMIGYQEITDSGSTLGDLVFYTRATTSNVAPSLRARIDNQGTMILPSTTPTPAVTNTTTNSCGTTAATIVGNNNLGEITVGATAGTSCTVTFTTTAPNEWICSVTDGTAGTMGVAAPSSTTVAIFTGTFAASDKLQYMCFPR